MSENRVRIGPPYMSGSGQMSRDVHCVQILIAHPHPMLGLVRIGGIGRDCKHEIWERVKDMWKRAGSRIQECHVIYREYSELHKVPGEGSGWLPAAPLANLLGAAGREWDEKGLDIERWQEIISEEALDMNETRQMLKENGIRVGEPETEATPDDPQGGDRSDLDRYIDEMLMRDEDQDEAGVAEAARER